MRILMLHPPVPKGRSSEWDRARDGGGAVVGHPFRRLLHRLPIQAQLLEGGGEEPADLERVSTGTRYALKLWLEGL